MRSKATIVAGLSLVSLALAVGPASAAQHEERMHEEHGHFEARHEGPVFHGEIGRFHEHDWAIWHGGRWEHGYHGGRLGWWWIAGGVWYFYPYPVYPYPDPYLPPTMLAAPVAPGAEPPPAPAPTAWYYCASARGYYPYVPSCPEAWQPVAPTGAPPAAPAAPPPPPPPPPR